MTANGKSQSGELSDFAAAVAARHELRTDPEARRSVGQVFTPPSICRYMSSLLGPIPGELRLLDPGAGVGSLTAAVCDRILKLRSPRRICATLYEANEDVIPLLGCVMQRCREALRLNGHRFDFTIRSADFVLAGGDLLRPHRSLFAEQPTEVYDAVIMNPPYFKLNKTSAHARAFEEILRGQPNIYALFLAIGAHLLRANGTMVAITPRSFCNGLYFRDFRRWFLQRMALHHVHLFDSRREAFASQVLQESLITVSSRLGEAPSAITISRSRGSDFSTSTSPAAHPPERIVDLESSDLFIRIPGDSGETAIMETVDRWPRRFDELGLRISTGPVVTFRAARFLLADAGADSVPLLFPHNVKPFRTVWPVHKGEKPLAFRISAASEKLLVPPGNYVLLKRFSAKEERRRLTAGCYIAGDGFADRPLALENHLNYIYHARRELTVDETYGLAALFNSWIIDRYFRTLSGNTQVNATEIRSMPFPDLNTIARIGARVLGVADEQRPETAESIVVEELDLHNEVAGRVVGTAG